MNLGDWLRELGCTQYELLFVENAIDIDVLPELTESDLENLKIPLGDRKRLLRGIKSLADPQIAEPDTAAGRVAQSERPDVAHAERRRLTVMICDLVGSTALSARLDPEDMRAVMDAYHAACARITLQYDGFLTEFRGDGIFAYFGYPSAHEDDAERTVRAGLDITAAIAGLKTRANESLAVRIGIATGLVVVGAVDSKALRQHAVVGDTPNIAARLQALAEPGMVIVATSTRRLIGDLFRLRNLGDHQVKGISEPVSAWVVEGMADSESRFEAIRTVRLAELIGREDEINFLIDRQSQAWNGKGQIVLISGEPGIGKSRILAALSDRIAAEPHVRLSYQCSPYHTNSALHPFIARLEHAARFGPNDTPDGKLDKLEAMLARATSRVQSVAPQFANLLSIPFGDRYPASGLSPTQQRSQTLAALLDQFEGLARREPILLLFEDAHWADATSLQLLDLAIERIRQLPVLALFTARPEFEFPWGKLPHVSTLTLGPLDRPDVEKMILRVARGRSLPGEVTNQIIAKTDGNPLFVEELTKAVLEGGLVVEKPEGYRLSGFGSSLEIPATLHDSLMARLDRLAPPVKEIYQIGAAIGREFSYELLRAVVGRDERSLSYGLAQLEAAELLFRRGAPPEATYSFKHALVQDAAYESLLKSRRQELHGQIARALEEKCAEIVASQPEIVAHHLTRAGLADPAVGYWLKAGNLALSRSANVEAVKHLKQGIELIQSITASPTRLRKELDLYLALAPALAATEGYVTPETLKAFSHARDLMGDNGSLTEQITVLWGAYLAHGMRAEHVESLAVARECLKVGAHHDHAGMLAMGHRFAGQALTFKGAFADARHHLEQALVLCTTDGEKIATYRKFGVDDQVTALSFLATNLLLLGYPEQAAAAVEDAVSRTRAINLPFTTAMTLSHVAFLGTLGGDLEKSAAYADEAIALTAEQGRAGLESTAIAAHQAHRARFIQGALLAQRGDPEHGIAIMNDAVAAAEHTGVRTRRTLYLGHLASAHASLGRHEIGLDLIEEAITEAEVTQERFFAAELYRLRGTILKALGNTREAEAGFRRALTIAREQQARWWELRASNDLAILWHEEAKGLEAYSLLQSTYGWFKESLDIPDLKRAKALLDELLYVSTADSQRNKNEGQHNLTSASAAPIRGGWPGNA